MLNRLSSIHVIMWKNPLQNGSPEYTPALSSPISLYLTLSFLAPISDTQLPKRHIPYPSYHTNHVIIRMAVAQRTTGEHPARRGDQHGPQRPRHLRPNSHLRPRTWATTRPTCDTTSRSRRFTRTRRRAGDLVYGDPGKRDAAG